MSRDTTKAIKFKHQRVTDLQVEEKYEIDSDLCDCEDVEKPIPYGAHLSKGEDMEVIPEEREDEVTEGMKPVGLSLSSEIFFLQNIICVLPTNRGSYGQIYG